MSRFSLLLAAGVMALSSIWIGLQVYRFQGLQMDMDEAIHATRGLDITSALVRGSLSELGTHTTKPHWYPPGHGFMLGAWFLLVRPSVLTARLYSTVCYVLLGLLLWRSARQIAPHSQSIAWVVPTLFLAADRLHLVHAGMSMLELPAMLFAWAGLVCFNLANQSQRRGYHFLAACFAWLCFFIKYNYGLIVFASLLSAYAWQALRQPPRSFARWGRDVLVAWLPIAAILLVWLFGLGEWRWLKVYATAQPATYDLWSEANLTYYIRFLWAEPQNRLALLLAGLGLSFQLKERRFSAGLVPSGLFFGFGLLMLTYKLKNEPRFGLLLLPPLWLWASAGLVQLTDRLRNRIRPGTLYLALSLLLALAVWKNSLDLGPRLRSEYENTNEGVNAAYGFIADTLGIGSRPATNVVMLGRSDQWNGPALRFRLEPQCMFSNGCKLSVLDDKEIAQGWPRQDFSTQEQERRYQQALQEADWIVLFSTSFAEDEAWQVVAQRDFGFERHGHPALPVRVTVLTRK